MHTCILKNLLKFILKVWFFDLIIINVISILNWIKKFYFQYVKFFYGYVIFCDKEQMLSTWPCFHLIL
jgi:hypothetical protein